MDSDRPLLGIALMLGFCVLAPVGDAIAKVLGQSVPLAQLVFIRFLVQAVVLTPLVFFTGRLWRTRGWVLGLVVLRTFLHILGIGAMFTALKFLPLADAVAIAFVMPFIMLLLGKLVLKEDVGSRRVWACLVGFCGTLMVVQPSFQEVGWPALLPIFVAVNFAFFMLITRQISRNTDPVGLQAVSAFIAMAVMVPVMLFFQAFEATAPVMIAVSSLDMALLVSIGLCGTAAHLLMTWSLRFAPSATLAPMQYLEIPVATLLGFLVFSDWPDPLASAGIAVTIGAGIYVILRERTIAAPVASAPVPAPPAE